MFEAGKSYRMVGGGIANIKAVSRNRLLGDSTEQYVRCWRKDGGFINGPSPYTLLPRAIETEHLADTCNSSRPE